MLRSTVDQTDPKVIDTRYVARWLQENLPRLIEGLGSKAAANAWWMKTWEEQDTMGNMAEYLRGVDVEEVIKENAHDEMRGASHHAQGDSTTGREEVECE